MLHARGHNFTWHLLSVRNEMWHTLAASRTAPRSMTLARASSTPGAGRPATYLSSQQGVAPFPSIQQLDNSWCGKSPRQSPLRCVAMTGRRVCLIDRSSLGSSLGYQVHRTIIAQIARRFLPNTTDEECKTVERRLMGRCAHLSRSFSSTRKTHARTLNLSRVEVIS